MKNNGRISWRLQEIGILLILLLLSVTFESCEKSVDSKVGNQDLFLKKIGAERGESFSGIYPSADGGYLTIGQRSDPLELVVTLLDKNGNQGLHVAYPVASNFSAVSRKMSDGRIWVSSLYDSKFYILSPSGEMLQEGNLSNVANDWHLYSPVCEGQDQQYYASFSNNLVRVFNSTFLVTMDDKGMSQDLFELSDTNFPGNLRLVHVYEADADAFKVIGNISLGISGLFGKERLKTFVATVPKDGSVPSYAIMDTAENSEYDFMNCYTLTKNGGVACVSSNKLYYINDYYDNALPEMEVFQFDKDQKLLWKVELDIGALRVSPTRIVRLNDDNLMVFGHCSTSDAGSSFKPFMAVIDVNGKLAFSRIYPELQNTYLVDGYREENGTYVLVGYTALFGQSFENADALIMRLDAQGNYH